MKLLRSWASSNQKKKKKRPSWTESVVHTAIRAFKKVHHSNPKEEKCQKTFKLLYNCAQFT